MAVGDAVLNTSDDRATDEAGRVLVTLLSDRELLEEILVKLRAGEDAIAQLTSNPSKLMKLAMGTR